jgi:ABC-type multidrug transport system permease subunit
MLEEANMVGIVVILVILWFIGVVTKNTLGGLLHILLVIAIIFLLINVIRGRGV